MGMCVFLNRLYCFGVVGLHTLGLQWGVPSTLGMEIFLNRFYWFGVVVLCTLGVNISVGGSHHSSIGYTGLLQRDPIHLGFSGGIQSTLGMAIFLNRFYWFGVVVLCTLGVNINVGGSHHSSIGYTGLGQQGSLHLGLIREGGPHHFSIGYTALLQRAPYTWASVGGFNLHWVWPYFSIGSTGLVQQGSVHLGLIGRVGPLGGSIYTGYVLISQSVIQVWHSRALYTWNQLAGERLLISQQIILV